MHTVPVPVAARRMAILLCSVAAIDAAVAFFLQHPKVWCALIPVLIPLLTPAVLFIPYKKRAN
jgi:hypothetical protein